MQNSTCVGGAPLCMVMDAYKYVNEDLADPRVKDSFWYGSPFPVLTLSLVYWIAVRYALPKFMEKLEAFQLKTVLQLYNLLQISLCIALLLRMDNSGYQLHYLWTCIPTDYSSNAVALNQLAAFKFTHLIKIVDLVETTFFCFRKKGGQVSFLHIYHHITTMLFTWISCKYIGGGMFAFSIVINAYVHLLMYTYYLMSSLGGKFQSRAMKYKPVVTIVQLVQLTFMIMNHMTNLLSKSCPMPKWLSVVGVVNISFLIKLFVDFYAKAYKKTNHTKTMEKKAN